jgi:site-specific recombinase XerD
MINLFKTENCGRPFFIFFDEREKMIEPLSSYSYFLNCNRLFSSNSIESYVRDVKLLAEFLLFDCSFSGVDYATLIKSATSASVNRFLAKRKLEGKADNTMRSCDRRIKYFFDWLYSFRSEQSLDASHNPYYDGKFKTPHPYRKSKEFLTYIQVANFLRDFKSENDRAFGHFMYDTGARVSEVARVVLSDLPNPNDFPDDFIFYPITIHGSKGRSGAIKNRDCLISRVVLNRTWRYFNNWVKPYIDLSQFRAKSIPVFFNSKGKPVKHKTVTDLYLRKSLKLLSEGKISSNIHPHRFRAGFAYSMMLSNQGRDMIEKLLIVKKQLGHKQIMSTEVYANVPIEIIQHIREMNEDSEVLDRYGEAQYIFDKTFTSQ